jgi:hypothetical protein
MVDQQAEFVWSIDGNRYPTPMLAVVARTHDTDFPDETLIQRKDCRGQGAALPVFAPNDCPTASDISCKGYCHPGDGRLTATGQLDPSFSEDGVLTISGKMQRGAMPKEMPNASYL